MSALKLGAIIAFAFSLPAAAQSVPGWAAPSSPSAAPAPAVNQMQPPGTPGSGAPTQVPLDGGLTLLALAGGAYAVRKLR